MDTQSMRATGGPTAPRVAVYGAGVIGQVYAGRLAAGGCAVWLLARGATFAELARHGLRLQRRESSERPQVALVEAVADLPRSTSRCCACAPIRSTRPCPSCAAWTHR